VPPACSLVCWSILRPWRWRRYLPPKRPVQLNALHGVISQKMILFITTAVKTSDPTSFQSCSSTRFISEETARIVYWVWGISFVMACFEGSRSERWVLRVNVTVYGLQQRTHLYTCVFSIGVHLSALVSSPHVGHTAHLISHTDWPENLLLSTWKPEDIASRVCVCVCARVWETNFPARKVPRRCPLVLLVNPCWRKGKACHSSGD
jgi:hypothetical protein